METSYFKNCIVPQCINTSIKTPNKLFIRVPVNEKMRRKWLKLARRDDAHSLSTTSRMYFCEDHFDLPNEMLNYTEYHIMGKVSYVRMKPGCLPSKFDCQEDRRKQTRTRPYISVLNTENGNKQSKINKHANETDMSTKERELLACRACLATGIELHRLHDYGLQEVLADISGFPVQQTDRYPQFVCRTCVCLLRKLVAFRRRCQAAVRALQDLEAGGGQITTESLATLNLQYPFHLAKSNIEISSIGVIPAPSKIAECKMETTDDDNQIDKLTDDCGELYGDSNVDTNVEFVQTQFTVDKTTDNPNYNYEASSFDMCSSGLVLRTKVKIEETTEFEKKDVSTGEDFDTTPANINNNNAHRKNSHHTPVLTEPVDSDISNTTELITKDGEGVLVLNEGNNKKMCNQTDVTSDVNHKMLDRHSTVCAPSIRFPRGICSYTTVGKTELIQHKQAHSKESAASDAATSLNNRKKRLHTNSQTKETIDKPYACNLCHKFFSYKSSLTRHKKIHTDEKLYICDICGIKTKYRDNFIQHLFVHDVKSSCNVFHIKCQNLYSHQRIHKGEEPYSCKICHKNFSDSADLAKHKITHTGKKKYSCDVCQKSFKKNKNFTEHTGTHTGEKPHTSKV